MSTQFNITKNSFLTTSSNKKNLTDGEIKHIIIKLQLLSIDLNKKVYNKN